MASLVYSLENQYFDGVDDYIDTGIKLFDTDKNWAIFADFTCSETQNETATVLHCMYEGNNYDGFSLDGQSYNGRIALGSSIYDTFSNAFAGNRHKIAFRLNNGIFNYVTNEKEITDITDKLNNGNFSQNLLIGAFQEIDGTKGRFFTGTVHKCYIYEGIMTDEDFQNLMYEIPTITIGTPSRTKISSVSGYDQATVTFQSDISLAEWEARATVSGQETGHGVGLLVESGTTLAANTDATVYVDDEELTSGDLEYTITIFGHGSNGYWSDGMYESVNILDLTNEDAVYFSENVTYSEGIVTFDTGTQNTDSEGCAIKVQILKDDWSYYEQLMYEKESGSKSVSIAKTDSFNSIRIALNGDVVDAAMEISVDSIMENGQSYVLSFEITQLSTNFAQIKDMTLKKVQV